MELGQKIKRLREQRELTIAYCASEIGVSPSTYRDWENGRAISGEPYLKIAKVFNVNISELFGVEKGNLAAEIEAVEILVSQALDRLKSIKARL